MGKIKAIGFDMDYTLAVYKSPEYEELGFDYLQQEIVKLGYPKEIMNYKYDSTFVTRGLIFDCHYGNLLKIDSHGNILVASHGLQMLRPSEIRDFYPNKFIIKEDSKRFYIYNTLFNLPEIYLLAAAIDMFEHLPGVHIQSNGVKLKEDVLISYRSMQKDVRSACDMVHRNADMKTKTCEELEKYVARDENMPSLLKSMSQSGKKLFLVTNSEYWYTEKIMNYLFDVPTAEGRKWTEFFKVSIVDSRKPLFFEEGTLLRQVNTDKGTLQLGRHIGELKDGLVYSGGSYQDVTDILGCEGRDIIYIGDHIFGDVLRAKKALGWKTFLIIPELSEEIQVWKEKKNSIQTLAELDDKIGEMFAEMNSASDQKPDISKLQKAIRTVVHDMDMSYGRFGSLFRTGSRNTFFAGQVSRFADLYASSFINLLHYPFSFLFRAEAQLMPHESSIYQDGPVDEVSETQEYNNDSQMNTRGLTAKTKRLSVVGSAGNLTEQLGSRPTTPTYVTHDCDFDDEEEEEKRNLPRRKFESECKERDYDNVPFTI